MTVKTTFIYGLVDPRTNEIRYVGKSNNPVRRLFAHCESCYSERNYKASWIRKLRELDLRPSIVILEEVPIELWEEKEQWWIAHERELVGDRLTNLGPGGYGYNGSMDLPGTAEKKRSKTKGKKRKSPSLETRKKMSRAKKGKRLSSTHREAIGRAHKGKKHSAEWAAKIGAAQRGRKQTEEMRRRISENNGGSKLSPLDVRQIRRLLDSGERKETIAIKYNVCITTIYNLAKRKTYRFVEDEDENFQDSY